MRRKKVTLQQIAGELGLTVHTVSKALRGLPGMSESTREDVFRCARRLGYRTKAQEAGMSAERIPWAGGQPRRFAMLLSSPFHQQQLDGLQARLNELGSALHPLLVPPGLVDEAELGRWLQTCGIPFMDGLFLTATLPVWIETALLALPQPKVMINYPPDSAMVDSVIWDVEHAIHLSVDMLHARGHRRILYVGELGPARGFKLRWNALQKAAGKYGIAFEGDADEPGAGVAAGLTDRADRLKWVEALADKLVSGGFTAVLCGIPGTAEWVCAAAASRQLKIPDDFSVIGMEHDANPYFPDMARPVLHMREAGERAAELMLRRIGNPLLPYEHVRLRGPFFAGTTVGRVSKNGME